jgi:hypothetical protein
MWTRSRNGNAQSAPETPPSNSLKELAKPERAERPGPVSVAAGEAHDLLETGARIDPPILLNRVQSEILSFE